MYPLHNETEILETKIKNIKLEKPIQKNLEATVQVRNSTNEGNQNKNVKTNKTPKKLQKGIFYILLPLRNCRKHAITFGFTPTL